MSYITVPAEKVIICCENVIKQAHINRLKRLEEIINSLANYRMLWVFPAMGKKKAEETLNNGDAGIRWQIPYDCNIFNKSTKREQAEKLLLLAKHGDPVIITDKHAWIFDYYKVD